MCIENRGAYDPHHPATDRRVTMYWIGWVFFGITITSIFIAGVMVSMYKMNIQDSKARSNGEGYSGEGDYDEVAPEEGSGADTIGTRRLNPRRKPTRRPPANPNRGHSRPDSRRTVEYNATTVHLQPNAHEEESLGHRRNPSSILIDDEEPDNRTHGG